MVSPKPILDVDDPLDELVDKAEKYLAGEPTIYQRSGEIVHVLQEADGYSLKPLKTSLVRYMLSRAAMWVKEEKRQHPPTSVARCLLDKTDWANVRPLRAVVPFPPIGTDGALITEKGYHHATKVFFGGNVTCKIPDRPTLSDAKRSVELLFDIVSGFPFASPAHRSAWIAGVLTPLARFAHDGNSPIVLVQANAPRVGKTRLVKLISHIVMGSDCPVVTHTKSEDEERKRILTYLRAGRSMVLVDNVVGQYGGATVNALATSRTFEDRVLGHTKLIQVPNDSTWYITGNNIILAPDTAERCLHIRLICKDEKPHLRTGFKYPDLFTAVQAKRQELLSAAIIILKAYIAAGRPKQKMEVWGSFESWSDLVRGAIVWCGLDDPAVTRAELETEADVGKDVASSLVEGWLELQKIANSPKGLTAREVHDMLSRGTSVPLLRDALEELAGTVGKLPNAHTIGRHLREIRDRTYNGRAIRCIPNEKTGHRWFVEE